MMKRSCVKEVEGAKRTCRPPGYQIYHPSIKRESKKKAIKQAKLPSAITAATLLCSGNAFLAVAARFVSINSYCCGATKLPASQR